MDLKTLQQGARSARLLARQVEEQLGEALEEERPSGIGMSAQDVRLYSITKAIAEVSDMCRARQPWRLSGIEGEAHRAIAAQIGELESAAAFYVPVEVQYRDQTAGVGAAGGFLVAATTGGSYIETLRNRSIAFRLGAQRLPGQRENLTVPAQSGAGSASWLGTEATQAAASQQSLQQLAASPKTVAAYTEYTRQLLLQSNPAIDQLVMTDLAAVVAVATDDAIINGDGASGKPLGIRNTANVGTFPGTTLGLSGLTEAQQDILDANALLNPATLGYATTPAVAKLLKNRNRFTGTDSPLWQGALHDGEIEGVRATSTNQMPTATMLYGDWSQVLVPEWGVLAVELNPYANFPVGIVGVRAMWSVDVIVRHPQSFTLAASIT